MALKQEPIDVDTVPFFQYEQLRRQLSHSDSVIPAMATPHPINFLTNQRASEVIMDPMQEEVVFLPQLSHTGRVGRRRRTQEVVEYANYTISHIEAELNSKHLPKKYRCRYCVYKTSYKSDLNRHLRKHGVAPRHCPLCNMPFKNTGNLENHIRQTHVDVAESMGIIPTSLSSLCVQGGFVPAVPLDSSSGALNLSADACGGQMSVVDSSRDQQMLQLTKDFPTLSQAVLTPSLLTCHLCPFVSSDSQILAHHILTHPDEEEVSKARHVQNDSVSIADITCVECGVTLSSVEELQTHRHSCESSGSVGQNNSKQIVQNNDAVHKDKTKGSSGENQGLPRRETMNKLRRALTNQTDRIKLSSGSLSPGSKTFRDKKEQSMVLPHVLAAEPVSDGKQHGVLLDSSLTHQGLLESGEKLQQNSDILKPHQVDRVSRRKMKCPTKKCDRQIAPGAAYDVVIIDPDPILWTTSPEHQAERQGSCDQPDDSPYHTRQAFDQHSHSSQENREERLNKEPSAENEDGIGIKTRFIENNHSEYLVDTHNKVSLSTENSSGVTLSHPDQAGKPLQTNVSVKEEPQSPSMSMEVDAETHNICDFSKTFTDNKKLDLNTTPLSLCSHGKEHDHGQGVEVCSYKGNVVKHTQGGQVCSDIHRQGEQVCCDKGIVVRHRQGVHTTTLQSSPQPAPHKVSEKTPDTRFELSQPQGFCPAYKAFSQDRQTNKDRLLCQPRVTSHPPSCGRYARLVSDFDEFASKPYACSLCFFRTGELSELSVHVNYHLTGGNVAHIPESARLHPRLPVSVDHGTSPVSFDSGGSDHFKSVVSKPDRSFDIPDIPENKENATRPQSEKLFSGIAKLPDKPFTSEESDDQIEIIEASSPFSDSPSPPFVDSVASHSVSFLTSSSLQSSSHPYYETSQDVYLPKRLITTQALGSSTKPICGSMEHSCGNNKGHVSDCDEVLMDKEEDQELYIKQTELELQIIENPPYNSTKHETMVTDQEAEQERSKPVEYNTLETMTSDGSENREHTSIHKKLVKTTSDCENIEPMSIASNHAAKKDMKVLSQDTGSVKRTAHHEDNHVNSSSHPEAGQKEKTSYYDDKRVTSQYEDENVEMASVHIELDDITSENDDEEVKIVCECDDKQVRVTIERDAETGHVSEYDNDHVKTKTHLDVEQEEKMSHHHAGQTMRSGRDTEQDQTASECDAEGTKVTPRHDNEVNKMASYCNAEGNNTTPCPNTQLNKMMSDSDADEEKTSNKTSEQNKTTSDNDTEFDNTIIHDADKLTVMISSPTMESPTQNTAETSELKDWTLSDHVTSTVTSPQQLHTSLENPTRKITSETRSEDFPDNQTTKSISITSDKVLSDTLEMNSNSTTPATQFSDNLNRHFASGTQPNDFLDKSNRNVISTKLVKHLTNNTPRNIASANPSTDVSGKLSISTHCRSQSQHFSEKLNTQYLVKAPTNVSTKWRAHCTGLRTKQRQSSWRRSLMMKSGQRWRFKDHQRYSCALCDKRFSVEELLRRHNHFIHASAD